MEYFEFFFKVIQKEAEKFNLPHAIAHFTELKDDANFDIASNRCAYIYRYATNTLYYMNKHISNFFLECPEVIQIFQEWSVKGVNFTSISSGPGIEFFAFVMSLKDYKSIKIQEFFKSVKILSKFGAWRNTMNIMLDIIEAGEFKCLEHGILNRKNIDLVQICPFSPKLNGMVQNSSIVLMIRSINLKQSDAELEGEISANVMEFFSALKLESLLFCIDTKPSCTLMANILMKFPGRFLHKPAVYQDRLPVMFPESFIEQFGCLPVLSCRGGFFVWQKLPESSVQQNLLFSPYDTSIFNNYSGNASAGFNLNEANGSLCDIKDHSNGIENISEELKTNQEQCSDAIQDLANKLEKFKNNQGHCSDAIEHLANKLMYSTSLSEKNRGSNTNSTQNPMFINPVVGNSSSLETNAQASLNISYSEDHVKNNRVSPLLNGTSTSSPVPLSKIIRPSAYKTPLKSTEQEENSLSNLITFGNGDIKDNFQGKINVSNLTEESMLQANIQQCSNEKGMGSSVSCSETYSKSDLLLIGNKNIEQDAVKDLNVCHKGDEILLEKTFQQQVNEEEAGKSISCKNNSSSSDMVLAENENALGAIPRKARHRKNKNKVADPTFIAQAVQTDPVNETVGFDSNGIKILMNKIQQLTSSFEKLLAEKSISIAAAGLPPNTDCSNHQIFTNNGAAHAHSMHPRVLNSCCNNFSNMNSKCNKEKFPSCSYAQKESSDIYGNSTNRFQFQEGCNVIHCCSVKNHCYDFHDHCIPRCSQMSCCTLRNYHSTLRQPNIVIPLDTMSNDVISQLISLLKTSSQP